MNNETTATDIGTQVERSILNHLAYHTGYTDDQIRSALMKICNPAEARMPADCQQHTCDYYTHYLVHHDPAKHGPKLDHDPYHITAHECELAQARLNNWYADHPNQGEAPKHLISRVEFWERKACA